jgi:hypothetical protein
MIWHDILHHLPIHRIIFHYPLSNAAFFSSALLLKITLLASVISSKLGSLGQKGRHNPPVGYTYYIICLILNARLTYSLVPRITVRGA